MFEQRNKNHLFRAVLFGSLCLALSSLASAAALDHAALIGEAFTGPAQCQTCHPGKIAEVQADTHYKFESTIPEGYQYDHDGNPVTFTRSGKLWKLCGFPTAFPAANWLGKLVDLEETDYVDKPGGCGKCHVGIGEKPFTMTGNDEPQASESENVDCLICHAATYTRRHYIVKEGGEPVLNALGSPVVLTVPKNDGVLDWSVYTDAAKTVGQTSSATCLRCHDAPGGGKMQLDDNNFGSFKRGEIYGPGDVHADVGLTCSDCHYSSNHTYKRALNNDLTAHTNALDHEMCLDCHGDEPHEDATYNSHTATISCTTCHTRVPGGVHSKDFSKPVAPNPENPLGTYGLKLEKTQGSAPMMYTWFNGTIGPEITPLGARDDGKIYPFKLISFNQPVDASGHPVPVKWGKYFLTGNMSSAADLGLQLYEDSMYSDDLATSTGIPAVPGPFVDYAWSTAAFSVSHGVTREKALKCANCHSPNGVMEFEKLGYSEEEVASLSGMFQGSGPKLGDTSDKGNSSIEVSWRRNRMRQPQRYLAIAYDLYEEDWVSSGTAPRWYEFGSTAESGDIPLGASGAYFVWVGGQYEDGSWYECGNPAVLIASGKPHTPLEATAADAGSQNVQLQWKPDIYGTWVYWVIAYDIENGEWAELDGPIGSSVWQYGLNGGDNFGAMTVTVPDAGQYWFFMGAMGWDAATMSEYAPVYCTVE